MPAPQNLIPVPVSWCFGQNFSNTDMFRLQCLLLKILFLFL